MSDQSTTPLSHGLPVTSAPFWSDKKKGFTMVILGAVLWGLSGTAAQQLFQKEGFTSGWMVAVRMSMSGILLLGILAATGKVQSVMAIWRHPRDVIGLFIFSILGLLGVQFTFFTSIQYGNAPTATFLQYLGPVLITLYVALRARRAPRRIEVVAVLLALIGTLLLVTNGSFGVLVIPLSALVWGLISALALAFYTVYPVHLLQRFGSAVMTGWGMLIGGLGYSLYEAPWQQQGQHWSLASLSLVVFVVLFGTLLAFYLYLASLNHISPSEAGVLGGVEPLSSAIAAVIFLHVPLGNATIIGGLMIVTTVIILSKIDGKKEISTSG